MIYIPGFSQLSVSGPPLDYKIENIYKLVETNFPSLSKLTNYLTNKGKKLDRKKTIKDYGIDYQNFKVQADVPEYMLTSKGLVKLMKVNGYW